MQTFEESLDKEISELPALSLAHTTDAYNFRNIIRKKSLSLNLCEVFKKELVYFYYGKPEYRSSSKNDTSGITSALCTFILELNNEFHTVFPFDTGAFHHDHGEFKSANFDYRMQLDDFRLPGTIDSAKSVVKTFFSNNNNYLEGKFCLSKSFGPLSFEAHAFTNLPCHRQNSNLDNRILTIELTKDIEVSLSDKSVKQIICPSAFLDDVELMDFFASEFDIELPLTYDLSGGNPNNYWSEINKLFKSHLQDETQRIH